MSRICLSIRCYAAWIVFVAMSVAMVEFTSAYVGGRLAGTNVVSAAQNPSFSQVPNQQATAPVQNTPASNETGGMAGLIGEPARPQADAAGNDSMLLASVMLPNAVQQVTLIDTGAKTLAVYHIDPLNGQVELKSARRITEDFLLDSFNGKSPTPEQIRNMLESNRK